MKVSRRMCFRLQATVADSEQLLVGAEAAWIQDETTHSAPRLPQRLVAGARMHTEAVR